MKLLLILFFSVTMTFASIHSCEDTLFTFNISQTNSNVRIIDIVENVAHECHFSVRIKDNEAKKVLNSKLFLVHINDYTLDEIFDFLFTQHNMFYKYDEKRNVLSISYLQTHSFVIDYVNLSEHSTDSIKTITVGAASVAGNNMGNNGSYGSSSGGSGSQMGNVEGMNDNQQASGNSDYTTIKSETKFEFWDKLSDEIDAILSRDGDITKIKSRSIINREAGVVTITGTKDQIDRISRYLNKIKGRLHKQVMLETKLFELRYADRESTGVDWSKFNLSLKGNAGNLFSNNPSTPGGSNYSFAYQFSMDGLIDFLNKYGNINVLSTPKILTLNNQPAVINVGNQINYRYESGSMSASNVGSSTTNTYEMSSVFIGLTLNIVPEITDNGYVILRINPVVSEELKDSDKLNDDNGDIVDENGVRIMPPDIKIKQLSSIVKAKHGSRVVIGGLISTTEQSVDTSIPLLSDIPIVGGLFQHNIKETFKTELIVVITPIIIDAETFPSIDNIEKFLDESLDE